MARKPKLSASSLSEKDRADLYEALSAWHKISNELAVLRDKEAELRTAISERFFANCEEGTNTMTLDYGKVLKVNVKINRTVDANQLEALKLAARSEGTTSVLALSDVLFNYKPNLVLGEWKELSQADRNLFADVVTEKPGMPTLSIETPKR